MNYLMWSRSLSQKWNVSGVCVLPSRLVGYEHLFARTNFMNGTDLRIAHPIFFFINQICDVKNPKIVHVLLLPPFLQAGS